MRQKIRNIIILVFLLAFPVTLNWHSPFLIVLGAASGIVTGSFILFAVLLITSLFAGRLWCSWLCPMGCLQDIVAESRTKPGNGSVRNLLKWFLWTVWLVSIILLFMSAGGIHDIKPLFMTDSGISTDEPVRYVIYYGVVVLFLGLSFLGKRTACHSVCWMAPFMILGSSVGRMLTVPQAHLSAKKESCTHCGKCTKSCPMSLAVQTMVAEEKMRNAECILCARCADGCPSKTICLEFSRNHDAANRE